MNERILHIETMLNKAAVKRENLQFNESYNILEQLLVSGEFKYLIDVARYNNIDVSAPENRYF